jgi:hypothetical protein
MKSERKKRDEKETKRVRERKEEGRVKGWCRYPSTFPDAK